MGLQGQLQRVPVTEGADRAGMGPGLLTQRLSLPRAPFSSLFLCLYGEATKGCLVVDGKREAEVHGESKAQGVVRETQGGTRRERNEMG